MSTHEKIMLAISAAELAFTIYTRSSDRRSKKSHNHAVYNKNTL